MRVKGAVMSGRMHAKIEYKNSSLISFISIVSTQGVTERCRLSWITYSALVYLPKRGGVGCGVDFGDLTPYLTYGSTKHLPFRQLTQAKLTALFSLGVGACSAHDNEGDIGVFFSIIKNFCGC
jgi:hypothetical protein